jgi:hypothetical protein
MQWWLGGLRAAMASQTKVEPKVSVGATVVSNAAGEVWKNIPSALYETRVDRVPSDQTSFFPREPGPNTAPATNRPASPISELPPTQQVALPLSLASGVRKVDAVIGDIKRDTVLVHVKLPSGPVDISLPPSLIPIGLLQFGTPVSISLDKTSGIRTPVVEARSIPEQEKLPGQDKIEAWFDSL